MRPSSLWRKQVFSLWTCLQLYFITKRLWESTQFETVSKKHFMSTNNSRANSTGTTYDLSKERERHRTRINRWRASEEERERDRRRDSNEQRDTERSRNREKKANQQQTATPSKSIQDYSSRMEAKLLLTSTWSGTGWGKRKEAKLLWTECVTGPFSISTHGFT